MENQKDDIKSKRQKPIKYWKDKNCLSREMQINLIKKEIFQDGDIKSFGLIGSYGAGKSWIKNKILESEWKDGLIIGIFLSIKNHDKLNSIKEIFANFLNKNKNEIKVINIYYLKGDEAVLDYENTEKSIVSFHKIDKNYKQILEFLDYDLIKDNSHVININQDWNEKFEIFFREMPFIKNNNNTNHSLIHTLLNELDNNLKDYTQIFENIKYQKINVEKYICLEINAYTNNQNKK